MSARTQSSRQVTVGRLRSPRRSGRADEEKWSSGAQQSAGDSCASVCRFMSPPFADSTHKKHEHPEPKCDSEEQQDHECVTKLIKLEDLHHQDKQTLSEEVLEQFTAPPPGSPLSPQPPQSPLVFLHVYSPIAKDHLVSRQSGQAMFAKWRTYRLLSTGLGLQESNNPTLFFLSVCALGAQSQRKQGNPNPFPQRPIDFRGLWSVWVLGVGCWMQRKGWDLT